MTVELNTLSMDQRAESSYLTCMEVLACFWCFSYPLGPRTSWLKLEKEELWVPQLVECLPVHGRPILR